MAKEIYGVRTVVKHNVFDREKGHGIVQGLIMEYIIGKPTTDIYDGLNSEALTPQKIVLKDNIIVVYFEELGIRHEFARTDDVELFYRDKVTKDASKTEDNTQ